MDVHISITDYGTSLFVEDMSEKTLFDLIAEIQCSKETEHNPLTVNVKGFSKEEIDKVVEELTKALVRKANLEGRAI